MKMVLVEWLDAVSYESWDDLTLKLPPHKVFSVGFLVSNDPEGLLLCLNWDKDEQTGSCFMRIPSGMILKCIELGGPRVKELLGKS